MLWLAQFRNVSDSDKAEAVEKLISLSTPQYSFFLLVILSVLMATFGLLLDSAAIVIGSMLIAPILYPILSLSLGLVISDFKLMSRSAATLVKSILFGITASALATFLFAFNVSITTSEILSRTEPSLLYFIVAVVAGVAVSVSLTRPGLDETLPGVAVSVALIPPLAVVGIGLAKLEWSIVSGSLVLFLINVIGIVFAGMVSFSLMNLYMKRHVVSSAVKKEDEKVERETKEAEKLVEDGD